MSVGLRDHHLDLPDGISSKLEEFRRRVWIVKVAEGLLAGVFGLVLSYLIVFALDRFIDTPAVVRWGILIGGTVGLLILFPLKCHRWVWRNRHLVQVARLLRIRFPRLGDQLLGIVELADSESEQLRSEQLVRAAMRQVDEVARDQDFTGAVPNPRHRRWAILAAVPVVIALLALVVVPAAGSNALLRWLLPWSQTARYTFAQLDELPDEMVVPYAEPFTLEAALTKDTSWSPGSGAASYAGQPSVIADLQSGRYLFNISPQQQAGPLAVRVGDARKQIQVRPMPRPELTSMTAQVTLPAYLQRDAEKHDVRGGSLTLVKGSRMVLEASASRELAAATVDGKPATVSANRLVTAPLDIDASMDQQFVWRDTLGLTAREPFVLRVQGRDDESPAVMCNKLGDGQVVLEEEVLTFEIHSDDDFGVKQVGLEWSGVADPIRNPKPARGEKIISVGDPTKIKLEAVAAFSPQREGIKPQTIEVRAYAIDYLPGRERVYSPVYRLHILSAEEHAIWLTNRFRKWFRQAQETYEREQQLHDINKELRALPEEDIDRPENRRRIEAQAAAENANARRLGALTAAGEGLIKQATRNSQFNVATLEQWAAMMQTLKDISKNRMPSVADLLKEAAEAPAGSGQPKPGGESKSPTETPPQVGTNRNPKAGKGGEKEPGEPNKTPSINDTESGFNKDDEDDKGDDPPSKSGPSKLTLPSTTLVGGPKQEGGPCPPQQKMDEAIKEQADLLAEFEKVAEELKKILGNLEGSTFVKRLKAASRRQLTVAGDLNKTLNNGFGFGKAEVKEPVQKDARKIAKRERAESDTVYTIQEDLEAYYNRVQEGKFRGVLTEMKSTLIVSKLKDIGADVEKNLSGQSISEAEYWADALDRWAEQLVGPG